MFALSPVSAYADLPIEQVTLKKGNFEITNCEKAADKSCSCKIDITYTIIADNQYKAVNAKSKEYAEEALNDAPFKEWRCSDKMIQSNQNGSDFEYGYSSSLGFENVDIATLNLSYRYTWRNAPHETLASQTIIIDKTSGKIIEVTDLFEKDKLDALNHAVLLLLKQDPNWDAFRDKEYATSISATDTKGYFYIENNRLNFEVRPLRGTYVAIEIPLEFISHPAIRKLYQEPSNASR